MQEFIEAYKDAIRFTENFSETDDFSNEALAEIEADCKNFLDQAFGLVKDNLKQAGHDFWLTRNRHGAGFWDDGWPEDAEKTLTDLAHSFGEKWYHLDENGFIES